MAELPQSNSKPLKVFIREVKDQIQASAEIKRLLKRTSINSQKQAMLLVEEILKCVEAEGDQALIKYTEQFDGFKPKALKVPTQELINSWKNTPRPLQEALSLAHQRIKTFHEEELPHDISINGCYGEKLGRRWRPVKKAGIYIPGGRASYPSTVLMNAIPAKVAGVEEISMVSPANKTGQLNQTVLAAAYLSGIKNVFCVGGAQAIGALAYGTETIKKVDVISGPGNIYVTLAKKAVYGSVGIDSLAGPSEVLIIADQTANIEHIAADMLAQAEHDPLASSVLLTTESKIIKTLPTEINKQLQLNPRANICMESLNNWGLIVLCKDIEECIRLSDEFAPEHLELLVKSPSNLAQRINHAGAIFLGPWSPEAIGDYLAGPNHTLPTSGTARFSGALGVETFMKNTSLIEFNQTAFKKIDNAVRELAISEGLHSHRNSMKVRSSF